MLNNTSLNPVDEDYSQEADVTCRLALDEQGEVEDDGRTLVTGVDHTTKHADSLGDQNQTTFRSVVTFLHHKVLKSAKHSVGDQTVFGNTTAMTGSASIDSSAPEAESMVDLEKQYEILRKFAEGGQGILSTAQDKILRRVVALKSLRGEHLNNPAIRQAFLNEAMITAQLEHPAIVSVYSLLKDEKNGVHLTMKLVRGKTLKEILNLDEVQLEHQRINVWEYLEIMRQHIDVFLRFCDAVAYAHSRGIIHCDLKPENLMVGEYGEAYVMDWGLAKNLNVLKNLPPGQKQPLDGTPRYMAPELFCQRPRDILADIYALGIILYEIATLQRPFVSKNLKELVQEVKQGDRRPVESRFGVPISPSLAAIINKASAYAPEERYQTVEELAKDLRRYLADEPIQALPDTAWMKARRFMSRHAKAMLSLVLLGWFVAFVMSALSLHQVRIQASTLKDANTFLNFNSHLFGMEGNVVQSSILLSDRMVDVARRLKTTVDYSAVLAASAYRPEGVKGLPILDYREYTTPGSVAFGKRESMIYYNRSLNPDILSYIIPKGTSEAECLPQLDRMSPISHSLLDLVLLSDGALQPGETLQDRKEYMLDYGLLIRRAYVGLENTGLQIAYPFNPEYSEDYDNRKRSWYVVTKEAFEKTGRQEAIWGAPYQDAGNGRPLLACTYPILNRQGEFIGVAGADIHFEKLIQYMKTNGNTIRDGVVEKFLVNREGTTLVHLDMGIANQMDVDRLLNVRFPLKKQIFDYIIGGEKKNTHDLSWEADDAEENEDKQGDFLRDNHAGTCGWVSLQEERGTYLYLFAILPNSDLFVVEKCSKSLLLASLGFDSDSLEKFMKQATEK